MHATGVTKKIEIQSWVPSEKNKCKQRNVGSRVKRQFSLGGNGMLHLPNGIRKIFKLHYWTKTSMKYKKKVESELVRYCFKCLRLESSRGIRIFSNLSQISNTTVLFHLHPNDLREIQCRKLIKALAFKLGERFVYATVSLRKRKKSVNNQPWVYKRSENHLSEVWKTELSSIVASWEEYSA